MTALPFTLTGAQSRAVGEILRGFDRLGIPMNRLVQGDVGSGKTMVAAAAAPTAPSEKWSLRRALMAPTEILAEQHFASLSAAVRRRWGHPGGAADRLHDGQAEKAVRRERIAAGESSNLVIGTHALLSESTRFDNLGAGHHRRAAPLRRGPAVGPGRQGGGPPPAGDVGDAHPPDAGADPLRRSGCIHCWTSCPRDGSRWTPFWWGRATRPRINAFIRKQVAEGHQCYRGLPGGGRKRGARHQGRLRLGGDLAADGFPRPAHCSAPRTDEGCGKGSGHGVLRPWGSGCAWWRPRSSR